AHLGDQAVDDLPRAEEVPGELRRRAGHAVLELLVDREPLEELPHALRVLASGRPDQEFVGLDRADRARAALTPRALLLLRGPAGIPSRVHVIYSPITLTSTRFLRRPSNSP